uniref:Transcriptional regulator, TetR family n=1 Tax=Caulobacter sp. (strain K31) TaxID=366602 RepID=B0T955_CAUSK
MVKVSRAQAAQNREAITAAAGKLFRERGVDGVGVLEIGRAAGLTQGALYSHFDSKEMLVAEALREGFEGSLGRMRHALGDEPSFTQLLDFHLDELARDSKATGCPMVASASEAERYGLAASERFAEGFSSNVQALEAALGRAGSDHSQDESLAAMVAIVGAVAMSRGLRRSQPELANKVLTAMRDMLSRIEPQARAKTKTKTKSG